MLDHAEAEAERDKPSCRITGAGIDWLTFTARTGEQTDALVHVADALAGELIDQRGHTSKPLAVLGYGGWAVGQLFWGERLDGSMVRASGETADYLARMLINGGTHGKPSRIDIAVTVQFTTDRETYAQETAEALCTSATRQAKGRPPSLALHRGFGGGDTCTIGARSSARFLRLYDKTREQGNEIDRNQWRFEVEYKDYLAPRIWTLCKTVDSIERMVTGMVASEYMEQGVLIPWDDNDEIERLRTSLDKTTVERQLRWLEKQVAPTLRRLERLGYGPDAIRVLGLDKPQDQEIE